MTFPDIDKVPATKDEVLGLVRSQADWITHCLQEPHADWTPALYVLARGCDGAADSYVLMVLQVPFNEDEEKRHAMRTIGGQLYAQKLVPAGAALSSECWIAPDNRGRGHKPESHPERLEGIVIAAASIGGKNAMMQNMVIGRDPAGKIVPGPWSPPQTEGVTTVLLNFLWAGFRDACEARLLRPDASDTPPTPRPRTP